MLDDVVQSLLCHPVKAKRNIMREAVPCSISLKVDLQPVRLRDLLAKVSDRSRQANVLQLGRMQTMRQIVNIGDQRTEVFNGTVQISPIL